ncbi:MAG: hypothetical protein R3B84_02325 [Zavarzinella sp.]
MQEYLLLTIQGAPDEAEAAFRRRLIELWTLMLRNYPEIYESVFAEASEFEIDTGVLSRSYMVEVGAATEIIGIIQQTGLHVQPIDMDDLYSPQEITGSEWFQIPHD